jgi:hypothetical protein
LKKDKPIAMIPEPSSLSLLVLGGVVVALRRWKKYAVNTMVNAKSHHGQSIVNP